MSEMLQYDTSRYSTLVHRAKISVNYTHIHTHQSNGHSAGEHG